MDPDIIMSFTVNVYGLLAGVALETVIMLYAVTKYIKMKRRLDELLKESK